MKIENWTTRKQIICCGVCKGTGISEREELVDYHKSDYDYWNEFCSFCGGEGRIVEITYSSRVDLLLPNGKTDYQPILRKDVEKLNGLKTSDIYKIGRK